MPENIKVSHVGYVGPKQLAASKLENSEPSLNCPNLLNKVVYFSSFLFNKPISEDEEDTNDIWRKWHIFVRQNHSFLIETVVPSARGIRSQIEVDNNPNNRGEQESNPGAFRPKASTISIAL